MANLPNDTKLVPQPAADRLNQRQQLNYETHRETLLQWLYHLGKNPKQAQGYSEFTVRSDAYRLDQFYRWVWEHFLFLGRDVDDLRPIVFLGVLVYELFCALGRRTDWP